MIFYPLYRTVLGPLSRTAFRVAGLFDDKIAKGIELRRTRHGRPAWFVDELKSPVWIHCSSGEFEYAKPVVSRLKENRIPVLVSYFSPTYVEAIRKFPGVDAVVPLPWDTRGDLEAFLDHVEPRAFLIARTDVWPEAARVTRERGIPSLLFSATLTSASGRARGLGRWISRAVFRNVDHVWCVSEADRQVFETLGVEAETKGDTRFDQVRARLADPKTVREELFGPDARPIFVAGSTWNEDEAVLIETIVKLKERVRFILVPHEPTREHLADLETRLSAKGLSSVRYSQAKNWVDEVLLVDQTGILAELYQKGRFAFVGNSFRKAVHSVMEPLAAGCLTFVGPTHLNNREALELKQIEAARGFTCVEEVRDAAHLTERLSRALDFDDDEIATRIREEIEKRTGASDLVAKWVLSV